MNDLQIEQLMHDVLDGVASAEERSVLEQRLAVDSGLRERFDELSGMFHALNAVPLVEPPADLHAGLMRRIEGEAGRTPGSGWWSAFADAFRARPAPAFALAALAITAATLALWTGVDRRSARLTGGDSPVVGTMAPPAGAPPTVLASGDASVSVTALIADGSIVVTLHGAAPSGASLDVETGLPGIDVAIEGRGASLAGLGAETGRISVTLEHDVRARLSIRTGSIQAVSAEVSLTTPSGTDRHEFALGPRGEGP